MTQAEQAKADVERLMAYYYKELAKIDAVKEDLKSCYEAVNAELRSLLVVRRVY